MNISRNKLKKLAVQVAKRKFGSNIFNRRPFMDAVAKCVKDRGYWTHDDDDISGSTGRKSKGLANIDYAISDLKREKKLLRIDYNQWRVP